MMRNPLACSENHIKNATKAPAKILQCWPAMRKMGVFFNIERCEMPAIGTLLAVWPATRASNVKPLAMWVERCKLLRPTCFQYFISHHKGHAAAQARFLKILLLKYGAGRVFIDSDTWGERVS